MLQLMQTVIRLLLEVLRQMYRSCLLQNQVNILLGKPEGTAQAIKANQHIAGKISIAKSEKGRKNYAETQRNGKTIKYI